MCYNCGCGLPNDDMGRGRVSQGGGSLTEDDIKILAEKSGTTVEDAKKNMLAMLQKQIPAK